MVTYYTIIIKGVGCFESFQLCEILPRIVRFSDTFGWSNVRVSASLLPSSNLPF